MISALAVIIVAFVAATASRRTERLGRKATADREALQALPSAIEELASAAKAVGIAAGADPAADEDFDRARNAFRISVKSVRNNAVRTAGLAWMAVALKAFSLDPQTPLSLERSKRDKLLDLIGETIRETY